MVQKVLSKIVSEIENLQCLTQKAHEQLGERTRELVRIYDHVKQEMQNIVYVLNTVRGLNGYSVKTTSELRDQGFVVIDNLVEARTELNRDIIWIEAFGQHLVNLKKFLKVESKWSDKDTVDIKKVLPVLSVGLDEDNAGSNLGLKTLRKVLEGSGNGSMLIVDMEEALGRIDASRKILGTSRSL